MIDITTLSIFLSDRRQNSALAFIAWIVLGVVAGFIGSKLINKTGHSLDRDILLGVVGAIVGGFLSNLFRDAGVPVLNLYSGFVAIIGAVAFLIIYHARALVGGVRPRRSLSNRGANSNDLKS
jgi:uncharacterized membrane protein YeaQ/YmgE (transglycosylase-associated protein family)